MVQAVSCLEIQVETCRYSPQYPATITIPPRNIFKQAKGKVRIPAMVVDLKDQQRNEQPYNK